MRQSFTYFLCSFNQLHLWKDLSPEIRKEQTRAFTEVNRTLEEKLTVATVLLSCDNFSLGF